MATNPLTPQDLETINLNLAQLTDAEEQIRQAEQAGLDVSDFKTRARDQRVQLLKLKQTYFPGQ